MQEKNRGGSIQESDTVPLLVDHDHKSDVQVDITELNQINPTELIKFIKANNNEAFLSMGTRVSLTSAALVLPYLLCSALISASTFDKTLLQTLSSNRVEALGALPSEVARQNRAFEGTVAFTGTFGITSPAGIMGALGVSIVSFYRLLQYCIERWELKKNNLSSAAMITKLAHLLQVRIPEDEKSSLRISTKLFYELTERISEISELELKVSEDQSKNELKLKKASLISSIKNPEEYLASRKGRLVPLETFYNSVWRLLNEMYKPAMLSALVSFVPSTFLAWHMSEAMQSPDPMDYVRSLKELYPNMSWIVDMIMNSFLMTPFLNAIRKLQGWNCDSSPFNVFFSAIVGIQKCSPSERTQVMNLFVSIFYALGASVFFGLIALTVFLRQLRIFTPNFLWTNLSKFFKEIFKKLSDQMTALFERLFGKSDTPLLERLFGKSDYYKFSWNALAMTVAPLLYIISLLEAKWLVDSFVKTTGCRPLMDLLGELIRSLFTGFDEKKLGCPVADAFSSMGDFTLESELHLFIPRMVITGLFSLILGFFLSRYAKNKDHIFEAVKKFVELSSPVIKKSLKNGTLAVLVMMIVYIVIAVQPANWLLSHGINVDLADVVPEKFMALVMKYLPWLKDIVFHVASAFSEKNVLFVAGKVMLGQGVETVASSLTSVLALYILATVPYSLGSLTLSSVTLVSSLAYVGHRVLPLAYQKLRALCSKEKQELKEQEVEVNVVGYKDLTATEADSERGDAHNALPQVNGNGHRGAFQTEEADSNKPFANAHHSSFCWGIFGRFGKQSASRRPLQIQEVNDQEDSKPSCWESVCCRVPFLRSATFST